MELKDIIKQIRIELGLSQEAFAKEMHLSFSTINRWENGRVVPNRLAKHTLVQLCKKNNRPVR